MKSNNTTFIALLLSFGIAIVSLVASYLSLLSFTTVLYTSFIIEFLVVFISSFLLLYFLFKWYFGIKIKKAGNISYSEKKAKSDSFYVQEIDDLKKMEKFRKEFLGNVSHELKTPLFNIQGYVSTLLDGGLEDDNINRKYLEKCDKSINRLISIIKDLETISYLESSQIGLQYENFNIYEVVREVYELQEFKARQKKIRLAVSGGEKCIMVYADRKKILEVLINLVVNSINYGKDEGRTVIDITDQDERVLIEVTDNGIGIPEESLPRIFERFYRVDKSRSRNEGGTGLGLSIVKHVVEAHNQKVSVKSKQGEGSTFGFTLQKAKK